VRVFQTPVQGNDKCGAIVLWGSGAVGHAVRRALLTRGCLERIVVANNWAEPVSLQQDVARAHAEAAVAEAAQLHHVFAAGSAGFSSDKRHCDVELATWKAILEGIQEHRSNSPRSQLEIHVHLISSAGGLFEGQCNVTNVSKPTPMRAYGHLKYAQERLLLDRFGSANSHIYRLSSVYDEPHPNRRRSLISNLILNSFAHRVTQVTGNLDTLRDYLPAADAANFIADCVLNIGARDAEEGAPVTLASGRSSTILEVLRLVELSTRRKPLIALAPAQNAASVSFQPNCLPSRFAPTDLRTQIGVLVRNYAC